MIALRYHFVNDSSVDPILVGREKDSEELKPLDNDFSLIAFEM